VFREFISANGRIAISSDDVIAVEDRGSGSVVRLSSGYYSHITHGYDDVTHWLSECGRGFYPAQGADSSIVAALDPAV
jgi:hypothetical protein